MRTLRLIEAARVEIGEIAAQYRASSPVVAQRFVDAIAAAFTTIGRHPEAIRLRPDGTRRLLLPGFPYSVVFRLYERSIVIIAVVHVRREPDAVG